MDLEHRVLFAAADPSPKRPYLSLRHILDANESITGLPTRVPTHRIAPRPRHVMQEARTLHDPNQLSKAGRKSAQPSVFEAWREEVGPEVEEKIRREMEREDEERLRRIREEAKRETESALQREKEETPKETYTKPWRLQRHEKRRDELKVAHGENVYHDETYASEDEELEIGRGKKAGLGDESATPILNRQQKKVDPSTLHRMLKQHATPQTPPSTDIAHAKQQITQIRKVTPLGAATSLPPPEHSRSSPDLSPLQQMRALRAIFESSRPRPRPKHNLKPRQRLEEPLQKPTGASERPVANFARYAFSLASLPEKATSHHSRTAIVNIYPPSHLTLILRDGAKGGSRFTYTITVDGGPVTIQDNHTALSRTYDLEELPWKHLRAYRYALRFVIEVKRKTLVAYGGIDGGRGKVWADGRGLIEMGSTELDGEKETNVELKAVERVATVFVHGAERAKLPLTISPYGPSEVRISPSPSPGKYRGTVSAAIKIYTWLLAHPQAGRDVGKIAEEEESTWRLDPDAVFVKEVGWCRRKADGKWSMMFLDGVRLELDPGTGDVGWIQGRRKKVFKEGMKVKGVRDRVGLFVKAGL